MNLDTLRQHPIDAVVIGASAGGIEALGQLLPALPARMRQPVLIVQHLPRDRPSLLVDIFAPRCALRVQEAEDKEPIVAGTIYFAPPDYHLLVDHGPSLALSADALINFSRPSIDVLFESAADVYGSHLLGLILSGANDDGSIGLAAVHRAGGITAVQAPNTATVPTMPAAAMKKTPVDFVLPLDQITGLLKALEPVHAA